MKSDVNITEDENVIENQDIMNWREYIQEILNVNETKQPDSGGDVGEDISVNNVLQSPTESHKESKKT